MFILTFYIKFVNQFIDVFGAVLHILWNVVVALKKNTYFKCGLYLKN